MARDQLRALETLHEILARNFQAALAGILRAGVEVRVAGVDQLTYLEFVSSLPNPTAFAVLSAEPLVGSFILEINPSVAFSVVERLEGARQLGRSQPERPLTPIEWHLLDRVIGRALELMRDLWNPIAPATFRVTAREANPRLMQVLSPNESVVSVTMEVSIGEQKGMMNLCIPVAAIEGHLERITSQAWLSSRQEAPPVPEAVITRRLARADVRVSAHLPVEGISLRELEEVRPGDLLLTSHPSSAPLLVSLEGMPKFLAAVGRDKDHVAFRVVGRTDEPGPVPGARASVRRGVDAPAAGAEPSLREALLRVPLPASVILAEKTARIRDVLSLGPGRILEFPKRADEPLVLVVGGRPLAEGTAVKIGERFGLQLESLRGPRAGG